MRKILIVCLLIVAGCGRYEVIDWRTYEPPFTVSAKETNPVEAEETPTYIVIGPWIPYEITEPAFGMPPFGTKEYYDWAEEQYRWQMLYTFLQD